MQSFEFRLLPNPLAICRLPPSAAIPPWCDGGPFLSITRTPTELSIVCAETQVPSGIKHETDRRALGITGVVDFATIGVIAGLTAPLAAAAISVFVVSTYDTDYILVRAVDLDRAIAVLVGAGHRVLPAPTC